MLWLAPRVSGRLAGGRLAWSEGRLASDGGAPVIRATVDGNCGLAAARPAPVLGQHPATPAGAPGPVPPGPGPTVPGLTGPEPNGPEPTGTGPRGPELAGPEPNGPEPNGRGPTVPGRSAFGQRGCWPGPEPPGANAKPGRSRLRRYFPLAGPSGTTPEARPGSAIEI